MKYNLLPRLLLVTSSLTAAFGQTSESTVNKVDLNSGFYLGQSFNLQMQKKTIAVKNSSNFGSNYNSFSRKSEKGSKIVPELYVGYRHYWNDFFIGAEMAAALGGAKMSLSLPGKLKDFSHHKFKSSYHLKPSIHIGTRLFSNATLFVKGGLDLEKCEWTIQTADELKKKQGKTLTRFTIGGGSEYHFSKKLAARLEFEYATPKTIKTGKITDTFNEYQREFKTANASTKLGLIYKF